MLSRKRINKLLIKLSKKLSRQGIKGEIGLVGGAAMLLAYDSRNSTRDVDAVFKPAAEIRKAVKEIAEEENLPEDWLNDGVKGFMPKNPFQRKILLDTPGLVVWVPEPQYLLAMKAISARFDTFDKEDLLFLIKKMGIKTARDVFNIVVHYYPNNQIPAKTQFFIDELFSCLTRE